MKSTDSTSIDPAQNHPVIVAGRREAGSFVVQLAWDDDGRPIGSVQHADKQPVCIYGWLGLMAQFALNMPDAGAGQT